MFRSGEATLMTINRSLHVLTLDRYQPAFSMAHGGSISGSFPGKRQCREEWIKPFHAPGHDMASLIPPSRGILVLDLVMMCPEP
jgi:hypothetical protein